MSALEQRLEIIRTNIPKLIENLTKFTKDEENYKRCEQFANYIIKNHRNLSVNSNVVRKRIEGMQEKFRVSNLEKFGDHLKILCENLITHPICLEHYEFDVQWSILEFLFSVSINPVRKLEQNKNSINLELPIELEEKSLNQNDYWFDLLKNDFIEIDCGESSDLSQWSDDSSDDGISTSNKIKTYNDDKNYSEKNAQQTIRFKNLNSPKKTKHYTDFNTTHSKTWLFQNCQNSWWMNSTSNCIVKSSYNGANFAYHWNKYINEKSNNMIKLETISTNSEHCLLREIIWMFNFPGNYKFFTLDRNKIYVRKNITIPSVSVNGLRIFLQSMFIPYIEQLTTLKKFIRSIYEHTNNNYKIPPKTYECYAACLQEILHPFHSKILELEDEIKRQDSISFNTVIQFRTKLNESLQYLEKIHEIHQNIVLDHNKFPAHITSAYLLSSLLRCFHNSNSVENSNLCITIFLSTIHTFCNIIDTWWSEGRLEDWANEFLVESIDNDGVSLRPYEKSKEISFFVPNYVSKVVSNSSFLKVLMDHTMEAGCTLSLLYKIGKIASLRSFTRLKGNLYETLMEEFFSTLNSFRNETEPTVSECSTTEKNNVKTPPGDENTNILSSSQNFLNECSSNDEFLLMAFASNMTFEDNDSENDSEISSDLVKSYSKDRNPIEIYKKLNQMSNVILPLEETLLKSINTILKNRISAADSFVVNLYRTEFEISKHLKNIRKVLLLESCDLLHSFYTKIFYEIESGKNWANPFALTVQLDDLMASKFPDVSALFKVEINSLIRCQTIKVVEAVDEITIFYNARKEIQNIVTEKNLQKYNEVFRFLLKIKWGVCTLEDMKFPTMQKFRPPYIELSIFELQMRRLEQLRFWMMYAIQNIHFHLMTYVLHSMGDQLHEKIENSLNLTEMKAIHNSYVKTICEHCFLTENYSDIKIGIEQLLNLVFVLRIEWNDCIKRVENELKNESDSNYILLSQIESIEQTYIRCHQYLAKTLNSEVYIKQNAFDVEHQSNLLLQIFLYFNVYIFGIWIPLYGYYFCSDIANFDKIQKLLTIGACIITIPTEILRLYLGYSGNLKGKVADMIGFWILTALIQLPIHCYLTITTDKTIVLKIIQFSELVFLFIEIIIGLYASKKLSNHQAQLYQLHLLFSRSDEIQRY